jgi:histidinol dehydrogenase
MRVLSYQDKNFPRQSKAFFSRRAEPSAAVREVVAGVVDEIRTRGDAALLEFTKRFDGADLTTASLRITPEELSDAGARVDAETRRVLAAAHANVAKFAKKSLRKDWSMKNGQGAEVGEIFQPFERVGVYVPGGSAPLVSTALMTVTFAAAAGVPEIVACSPCSSEGKVNDHLLYALHLAGATEIYKVGGAQAIAAMALGTRTIRPVVKVFGPGNSYVVEAKRQLFGTVAVDLLPGPSEVLILADSSGRAEWIAADILAQAEHGGDSIVAFLTDSAKLLADVTAAVEKQVSTLTRQGPLRKVLKNGCRLVLVESMEQGIALCNDFAPEHLSLISRRETALLPTVRTAGAIFLGNHSPVAVGDFLAGPSHTLPTGGAGKSFPGLMADMFQRRTSIVRISPEAMAKSAPLVEKLAALEGLDAHARSAAIRVGR